MHAHLVKVVKFLMSPKDHQIQGNDPIYELLSDVVVSIRSTIVIIDQFMCFKVLI
jgi:hypothetical protein